MTEWWNTYYWNHREKMLQYAHNYYKKNRGHITKRMEQYIKGKYEHIVVPQHLKDNIKDLYDDNITELLVYDGPALDEEMIKRKIQYDIERGKKLGISNEIINKRINSLYKGRNRRKVYVW